MLATLPLPEFMFIFCILLLNDPSVHDLFRFDFPSFYLFCILDASQVAHVDCDFGKSNGTTPKHAQGHSLRDAPMTSSNPNGDATGDDGNEDIDDEC